MLAHRNLRSGNIADEAALTVVAAPMAALDSAASDISAATVMVTGCQPHLGTGVAVRIEVSVD